jgi:hypothetical protein
MHDPTAGIEAIQMPRSMGLAPLNLLHKRIMWPEFDVSSFDRDLQGRHSSS